MSTVLCGFLEYISRDKLLKRKYGAKVCRCLLSQWSLLGSWWGETFDSDRRLAAINILKKVLNLEPKVSAYSVLELIDVDIWRWGGDKIHQVIDP